MQFEIYKKNMCDTTVIVIRHAEKLEWKGGCEPTEEERECYVDNHVLSPKGYERSHALVGYFTDRAEMKNLFSKRPLAALIAQGVDSGSDAWGKSCRPKETVLPLALALETHSKQRQRIECANSVPLLEFTKKEFRKMIDMILGGAFQGKSVILCWSHQQMPAIATSLGVPDAQVPRKWKGGRFDITWVVDLNPRTHPMLVQFPQNLMYGDSNSVFALK